MGKTIDNKKNVADTTAIAEEAIAETWGLTREAFRKSYAVDITKPAIREKTRNYEAIQFAIQEAFER